MSKLIIGAAILGLTFVGSAQAANLVKGVYASTGSVASNNGSPNCAAVGLSQGAANISVLSYPGAGKKGLTIYVPGAGLLQLCSGFAAVPAGGLNNFSSPASCAIYSINGNAPAETVNFSFTSTVTDANSGVGTTTIAIPATSPIGSGCTATVNTTIVRSGK